MRCSNCSSDSNDLRPHKPWGLNVIGITRSTRPASCRIQYGTLGKHLKLGTNLCDNVTVIVLYRNRAMVWGKPKRTSSATESER